MSHKFILRLICTLAMLSVGMFMTTAILLTGTLISSNARSDGSKETQGNVGRGTKSWADNCVRCHNLRDPKEFRDDLWVPIVYHMGVRAGLPGQETRDINAFLQASN